MSATEDGDVADGHISAEFQGNGLVASADGASLHVASFLGIVSCQSLTVNHAMSSDADILLAFCPDKRVVEVGVSAVLIFWSTEHLTLVVCPHFSRSSQYLCASH